MSKRNRQVTTPAKNGVNGAAPVQPPEESKETPVPGVAESPKRERIIEDYRRCPICWNGRGGYGTSYSTKGSTRYYKCDQSVKEGEAPCGFTWTAIVKPETVRIDYRVVTIQERAV